MKLLFSAFLFFAISLSAQSQSLQLGFAADHQNHSISEFPLTQGVLSVSQGIYSFGVDGNRVELTTPIAFNLSGNKNRISAVSFNTELVNSVYQANGVKLSESSLDFFDPSDETIETYALNDGTSILRDNVANFTFFDAAGNRGFSFSNTTQAAGGEQPSGVAYSESGDLIVTYNPVVQYNGSRGSRASVVLGERDSIELFSSRERVIENVKINKGGSFIAITTSSGNGNTRLHLFDRYGNNLIQRDTEMELSGFDITDDGRYLTLYSANRVQVYRTHDWERLGSSTSRSTVIHASYDPAEDVIISLGGQLQNNRIGNIEITAIDLAGRQLVREQLSGSVSILNREKIDIQKEDRNSYSISGINRPIDISVQF
ncbi:hypothetical protein DYD21_13290 [Rhodohalobacter sp. SW132]|uniref:hypothetical protein n=1 Tax=Rhodohalobacter sp. SW132 TaxID=2293433 RepID=UPI000E256B4D|nr:hypothetical protein [Rhodohalobacter sp. SW132]REL33220.1 hypothetical protein DYD21_13290 [Rhodohalobacter sp. SW132]